MKMKRLTVLCFILLAIFLSCTMIFSSPLIPIEGSVNGRDQIRITWSNPYGDTKNYPYSYKLMQSSDGGANYHPISTWIDGETVKVLNLRPSNAKQSLHEWMEVAGRGVIDITEVYLKDYNDNPGVYLKDSNGKYKYDVLVFGTSDWNGKEDLSSVASIATEEFIQAGRGVLFGHDTILKAVNTNPWWGTNANHPYFNRLSRYVGINTDDEYNKTNLRSSTVSVIKNGLLTEYPNKIDSSQLTIPSTHAFGQYTDGTATIWMTLFPLSEMRQNDSGGYTDWYLVTKNNTAMIQTGDSDSEYPTLDEEKVFANTIFYLKQITDNTYAVDNTAYDTMAPTSLSVSKLSCPTVGDHKQNLRLSATDQGNTYKYYLEGYPQREEYGNNTRSEILSVDSASGINGYWYTINNSSSSVTKPSASASGWVSPNNGSHYDFTSNTLDNTKIHYLHFFAKDIKGNVSDEKIYTIPVNNAPVISIGAKTFYEGQYTQAQWNQSIRDAGLSATDKEDGVITKNVSLTSDRVNINKAGTYTVSYKVKDSGCITTTKNNTITVKYNNPPVITAKDQTFYENQYTKDQWLKQLQKKGVTASDVEDGTITNKIKVIEDNVNPKTPGTYKVTYEVTDKYQKTTTKSVKVIVKFNNPPVITAPAKSFYESELSKSEWEKLRIKDVIASDVEDGRISKIDIVQDDVILDQSGVYNVVYRTTDQWGKSTERIAKITVKYNNPPVLTAKDRTFYEGQYTESHWKNTLRMKDVAASDTEDGNITNKIEVIEDNVNVKVPGVYYVKYKATDAFGKSTEKQISVTVKFNNPPMIEKESINIHEGEYSEAELEKLLIKDAASEDVEDGTITDKIKIIKNDVDPSKPGSYEVTYEVTDAFGKTTIKTIDVNVIENQQPTLQIFAPSKRFIEGSITNEQWHKERISKVTAHDREDNNLTDQITVIKDTTIVDKAGEYEVTYKVTDKWNKSTEKIAKVTVEPNEAPVIYASDIWFKTTDTVDQRAILSNVFAFDDHDGELTSEIVIASSEVQSGVAGEYKVTYKVQDRFGKHTAKQVTIHIEDYGNTPIPPKPPIITDPEALQLWNGRELAEINISKLMEDSIFNHSDAYQDVVFGVFAAEDVVYKGEVVITKDSMIAISKVDTAGQVYAKLYHKGKYYLQELATDHHYQLDHQKYFFDFR